ncbi:hypothetical protein BFP76_02025 [Amylibacter kogurei]|uniref:Enoyl-CoA hydratase n=1 Tax=Paramylibacter kogurei TaxID=1889778 RepID=A0A2G5K3D3_9RHOB|nr:crotonase/enoyl-CoA hydratase family protein [Amylibacter kogurei]PIB24048.1 hypothetical protein BFP76_02025 [Amylibacter kogurei]
MLNTLTLDIDDNIALVTLNRPDKKNAMSFEMMQELAATGAELAQTAGLRAVIIQGADNTFCSGIDLASLMSLAGDLEGVKKRMIEVPEGAPNEFQAPAAIWADVPVPVIAVIEGVCFGAGAQLALGADFRIAAEDAKFAIMEAKWGLIPDMGISQSLPRLMRADQALDLIMTGRVLDMKEAKKLGLITHVAADPLAVAMGMIDGLKQQSPDALAASKRLVNETWGTTKSALNTEARIQAEIIGGKNQMEKVAAQMAKRPPKFT